MVEKPLLDAAEAEAGVAEVAAAVDERWRRVITAGFGLRWLVGRRNNNRILDYEKG